MGSTPHDLFGVATSNYDPKVSFSRGILWRDGQPEYGKGFWKRHRANGKWSANPMDNAAMGMPFGDESARWEEIDLSGARLKVLRQDQKAAVAAWEMTRRGLVVMPTGSGKTEVAMHIIRSVGSHTLFIAPTRALAYEIADRLEAAFKVPVGFIGDHTFRLEPLSVATYDSAAIKMEFIGDYFKLIVYDEVHHLTEGGFYADAARMAAAPYRLGLTATPNREARGESEKLIGPLCYEMPISEARGTILAEYVVKRIPVYLTDAEQAEYDALGRIVGDHIYSRQKDMPGYRWEDVVQCMAADPEARHAFYARLRRRSIEENAAEKIAVLEEILQANTSQAIIFTGENAVARRVSTRFLIPCLLATTGRKERRVILDGYRAVKIKAIVANRCLNEGVDVKEAKTAVIIGGTGSPKEAIQRLGRILRKNGDEPAVLYEVVCAGTGEEKKSRNRRRNDAYQG